MASGSPASYQEHLHSISSRSLATLICPLIFQRNAKR